MYVYLHYSSGDVSSITSETWSDDESNEPNEDNETCLECNSQVGWGNAVTGVDELSMAVKVYADGQNIVIESPVAQSATICDIAGRAQRVALQEGLNVIPASGTGIHIVRVGEKTTKLMIR